MALYKLATKGRQLSSDGYSFEWHSSWTYPEVLDVASPIPARVQGWIDGGQLVTASGTDQTNFTTEAATRAAIRAMIPQVAEANTAAATTSAASAATATTPPAGGTGATAGAYDTSAHRDALIASVAALVVDVADIRTKFNQLVTDVAAIRTKQNNVLTKLRSAGIIAP